MLLLVPAKEAQGVVNPRLHVDASHAGDCMLCPSLSCNFWVPIAALQQGMWCLLWTPSPCLARPSYSRQHAILASLLQGMACLWIRPQHGRRRLYLDVASGCACTLSEGAQSSFKIKPRNTVPCEPVSWRLLDMKTGGNLCNKIGAGLVFPYPANSKRSSSVHIVWGTQLAQVQLSEEGAAKGCTKALPCACPQTCPAT